MSCERTSANASLTHPRFTFAVWNLPLVHSLPRDPRILDPISEAARSPMTLYLILDRILPHKDTSPAAQVGSVTWAVNPRLIMIVVEAGVAELSS